MPLSIPTFDIDTPNRRRMTLRLIDSRGDKRAFGFECPPTATLTNTLINNFLNTYGTATNANLYSIEITNVWEAPALSSVASDEVYTSLDAIVGVLFKSVTPSPVLDDVRLEVRAPRSIMVREGEWVDTGSLILTDVIEAFDALIGALFGVAYQPVSARFTERRDRNSAIAF